MFISQPISLLMLPTEGKGIRIYLIPERGISVIHVCFYASLLYQHPSGHHILQNSITSWVSPNTLQSIIIFLSFCNHLSITRRLPLLLSPNPFSAVLSHWSSLNSTPCNGSLQASGQSPVSLTQSTKPLIILLLLLSGPKEVLLGPLDFVKKQFDQEQNHSRNNTLIQNLPHHLFFRS